MVDVNVDFTLSENNPVEANFTVQPDVEYTADIKVETSIKDHDKLNHRDLPDQHPIDAITDLRELLERADTYIFEQGVASDTWVIEHNQDKYPSVTVVDSAGNVFTPAVHYDNENQVTVTMNGATTGKAYLN